jgi:hypothetical protein
MQTLRKNRHGREFLERLPRVADHAIIACTAFALVACSAACGRSDEVDAVDAVPDPVVNACSVTDAWSGTVTVGQGELPPGPVPDSTDTDKSNIEASPVSDVALQEVTLNPGSDGQSALKIDYRFSGNGQIGWSARYTSLPLHHADSEAVPVAGTCVLQVDFTGFDMAAQGGAPPYQPRVTTAESSEVVEVVTFGPTTGDGITQSFIGFRSAEPTLHFDQVGRESSLEITTGSSN